MNSGNYKKDFVMWHNKEVFLLQQISVDQLTVDMVLAEEINSPNGTVTLGIGTIITEAWAARIAEWGIKAIKIRTEKESATFDDNELDKMLQSVLEPGMHKKEDVPVARATEDVFFKVYNGIESQLCGVFLRTRCNGRVDIVGMERLSKKIAESILSMPKVLLFIQMPTRGENYLYRHALDVAVYAGLLGRWLQYSKADIAALVYAGLIHDIGKAKVLFEIISKPGRLNPEEQTMAQKHVSHGVRILTKTTVVPEKILAAVRQHHERIDGSGYPGGLTGGETTEFAKILAIVDVYDALTSNRYYKKAVSPMRASEIMYTEMNGTFDVTYLNIFLTHVFAALVGESVTLSNGMQGKLISFADFPDLKPVVELAEGEQIDLAHVGDIKVMKINFEEWV